MGAIYEGALLTVAALASKDGNGGCWTTNSWTVQIQLSEHQVISFGMRISPIGRHRDADVDTPSPGVLAPLAGRKWAMQERLLSRRILQFTSTELVWACKDGLGCECRPETRMRSELHVPLELEPAAPRGDDEVLYALAQKWTTWVRIFSSAALTYESDVFPAIAGVARVFRHQGLGSYKAGMWTNTLPWTLCWYPVSGLLPSSTASLYSVEADPTSPGRPRTFVAPTWSWAAVGEVVAFESPALKRPVAHIVKVECTLVDGDEYGRISAGYLELETFVLHVSGHEALRRRFRRFKPFYERFGFDRFYLNSTDDLPMLRKANHFPFALLTVHVDGRAHGIALVKNKDKTYSRLGAFNMKIKSDAAILPFTYMSNFSNTL
ncbi:hypothetical protein LTR95_016107 [Oleoguttula sp. CCFEE 5521]